MHTASRNNTRNWTLELRFPIYSSEDHGGLINLLNGSHYPGSNPLLLHPAKGQRFWWATFANALHASWWSHLNSTTAKDPDFIKSLCQEVIAHDNQRNGFSQFLVDANNAAPTCYYEAASQNLGGHQYMHNPDNFGYLEFANGIFGNECKNVQWLARFVLAQIYQAQVQYLTNPRRGNGAYTSSLAKLLYHSNSRPSVCTIDNACNSSVLSAAAEVLDISIVADDHRKTGPCAQYAIGNSQSSYWTGGPCFTATVSYTVQSMWDPQRARHIVGSINEARFLHFEENIGQRWDEEESSWLCLERVYVLGKSTYYI